MTDFITETEQNISSWLGLKVVIVRGWDTPDEVRNAARLPYEHQGYYKNHKDDPYYLQDIKQLNDTEARAGQSLRDHMAQRDPQFAASLSDEELRSLLTVGHVTRRENVGDENIVVVFDPIKDDSVPDMNWMTEELFGLNDRCSVWNIEEKFKTLDLIENIDIDPMDLYAYEVLLRVRYALSHQNELSYLYRSFQDPAKPEAPFKYFSGLLEFDYSNKYYPHALKWEKDPKERIRAEAQAHDHLHGRDDSSQSKNNFYASFARLKAVGNIQLLADPRETIERMIFDREYGYTRHYQSDLLESQKELSKKEEESIRNELIDSLKTVFEKHSSQPLEPVHFLGSFIDVRVLFPAFREVYETDQSTGAKRAFMNVVMMGLQKYFPTVTNAPVPDLGGAEPPRTLEGYKEQPKLPQPPPPAGP